MIVDSWHALYVGWVAGIARRNGVEVMPVMDGAGNYTNRLVVPFGDHEVTVIVPPPPEDWEMP